MQFTIQDFYISDIHASLRSRERLISLGAGALSNAEMLAVIMGVGSRGLNDVPLKQEDTWILIRSACLFFGPALLG